MTVKNDKVKAKRQKIMPGQKGISTYNQKHGIISPGLY